MGKRLYTALCCLLIVAVCLALGAFAVFNQPRFGKLPQGDWLDRIQGSPNYKNGKFQNLIPTPKFSKDVGLVSVIWNGFFDKNDRLVPDSPVASVKTDLKALTPETDALVWLGHSSWFIQIGGKRILIDPVFSDYAAPFSFMNRAFDGTTIYAAEDMPEIDCLLISHDHWDHLDYYTVLALRSKVKQVICPLGVGALFEYWDYPVDTIREGDWWEEIAGMSGRAIIEKNETDASEAQTVMKISVTANGNTTVFELNNSSAARALYAQLPLSIKVEDYGNNEKIFYPPKKLNTTDTPQAAAHEAGALAYYAPWGDVVMFYDRFGSAAGLYTLGHAVSGTEHIHGMSGTIRIEKTAAHSQVW